MYYFKECFREAVLLCRRPTKGEIQTVRVLCSKESHGPVLHMFILCCIIVKDRCSTSCMPHDNEDGQSVADHEDDQLPCSLTED